MVAGHPGEAGADVLKLGSGHVPILVHNRVAVFA